VCCPALPEGTLSQALEDAARHQKKSHLLRHICSKMVTEEFAVPQLFQ